MVDVALQVPRPLRAAVFCCPRLAYVSSDANTLCHHAWGLQQLYSIDLTSLVQLEAMLAVPANHTCLSAFPGSSLQWARLHDRKSYPVCIAWYEDLLYLSRCDWAAAAAATRTAEYHYHDVDDGVEAFAR